MGTLPRDLGLLVNLTAMRQKGSGPTHFSNVFLRQRTFRTIKAPLNPKQLCVCGGPTAASRTGIAKAASVSCGDDRHIPVFRFGDKRMLAPEARVKGIGGRSNVSYKARCFRDGESEVETVALNSTEPQIKHLQEATTVPNPMPACLCISRTIFGGEVVEHSGVIIVKGDVNHGASVRADGDIIILGRLQGEAHAGRSGDRHAMVFALQMEPTDIGIADCVALGPDSSGVPYAEIASLLPDGKIGIQPAVDRNVQNSIIENGDIKSVEGRVMGMGTRGDKAWFGIDGGGSVSKPSQLAFFTGAYISIIGFALLLFPKPLFGTLFDLESVALGWIRVGAILAVVFGVYYIGTAWGDAKGYNGAHSFYMSTIIGRTFLFFSFCWLVAVGAAPPPLLIVGAVNLIGALLMLKALQAEKIPSRAA